MTLRLNPSPGDQWLSDISQPIASNPPPPPQPPQNNNQPPPSSQPGISSQIGTALGVARLASKVTGTGVGAVGGLSNLTGIYSGLEQGGVGGDLSAAANAATLAGKLGGTAVDVTDMSAGEASAVSTAQGVGRSLGEVAPVLVDAAAIYSFANAWQSGKTGSDALAGAESGAAIGTTIMPGIGTIAGAVIGGAIGALSSAFGGGATDPETKNWQSFIDATGGAKATPAQVAKYQNMHPQAAFNLLAGVMDIKNNRIPIVNAFGRMGETKLLNGMLTQINSAYKAGKIKPGSSPQQIFKSIVTPWLNSKGATIGPETGGLQLQAVLTSLIGSWQKGGLTANTPLTATGSKDTTIPPYAGNAAKSHPLATQTAQTVTQQLATFGTSKQPPVNIPPLLAMPTHQPIRAGVPRG